MTDVFDPNNREHKKVKVRINMKTGRLCFFLVGGWEFEVLP